MAIDNRARDVEDILDKVTVGWISPPTQPAFIIEDRENRRGSYLGRSPLTVPDNGIIFIKQDWFYDREKITNTHANRLWHFPIAVISEGEILFGVYISGPCSSIPNWYILELHFNNYLSFSLPPFADKPIEPDLRVDARMLKILASGNKLK